MLEGLNLKDQLPKAIDWGCFCFTDGDTLVAKFSGAGAKRRAPTAKLLA
jgi:hypothetical protein